uniref:Uncharacterized protein n=1 Tax=Solanum tuberosum TaxID=4113 RepID=M1AVI2_SOLTU
MKNGLHFLGGKRVDSKNLNLKFKFSYAEFPRFGGIFRICWDFRVKKKKQSIGVGSGICCCLVYCCCYVEIIREKRWGQFGVCCIIILLGAF